MHKQTYKKRARWRFLRQFFWTSSRFRVSSMGPAADWRQNPGDVFGHSRLSQPASKGSCLYPKWFWETKGKPFEAIPNSFVRSPLSLHKARLLPSSLDPDAGVNTCLNVTCLKTNPFLRHPPPKKKHQKSVLITTASPSVVYPLWFAQIETKGNPILVLSFWRMPFLAPLSSETSFLRRHSLMQNEMIRIHS